MTRSGRVPTPAPGKWASRQARTVTHPHPGGPPRPPPTYHLLRHRLSLLPHDLQPVSQRFQTVLSDSPPLRHTRPVPPGPVLRGSHVSRGVRRHTPPGSPTTLGARALPKRAFGGPRFQSISLTHVLASTCWLSRSLTDGQRLASTYRDAPSRGAITRLSCTAIRPAFARRYQTLQISPQVPDASRRPQQPTCSALVVRSPAPPAGDLHPLPHGRVGLVTQAPVSVSPNPRRSRRRIGSKRTFQSPAPFVAWRAELPAPRFGVASPPVGDRGVSGGRWWGWRPPAGPGCRIDARPTGGAASTRAPRTPLVGRGGSSNARVVSEPQ